MKLAPTPIEGLLIAHTELHTDARGAFARWFCESDLADALVGRRIVQVNHSRTAKSGAVRGMHYQKHPHGEMKLVRCIRGRVWDVAVDLRKGSPTMLQWHAEELSAENGRMMVLPEGFAHGFQVLEPGSEMLYLHTAAYKVVSEGGVSPIDPALTIQWPLEITEMSDRDRGHPLIGADFGGLIP